MSKPALTSLSRFDPTGGEKRSIFALRSVDLGAGADGGAEAAAMDDAEAAVEATVDESGPDPLEAEREALKTAQAQFEQGLAAVNQALVSIEADKQAQILSQLLEMTETLFPALGRAFLAEEIAVHLKTMLPTAPAKVDLYVGTDLAEAISSIVAREADLKDACQVHTSPDLAPFGFTLDWGGGGYDLDFDRLVLDWRNRLSAKPSE